MHSHTLPHLMRPTKLRSPLQTILTHLASTMEIHWSTRPVIVQVISIESVDYTPVERSSQHDAPRGTNFMGKKTTFLYGRPGCRAITMRAISLRCVLHLIRDERMRSLAATATRKRVFGGQEGARGSSCSWDIALINNWLTTGPFVWCLRKWMCVVSVKCNVPGRLSKYVSDADDWRNGGGKQIDWISF